jgi:integrase
VAAARRLPDRDRLRPSEALALRWRDLDLGRRVKVRRSVNRGRIGPPKPLTREAAYRAVKAAAGRAGVPWAGLKTLRHICASILFRQGANAKEVQGWLGHHSAAFTLATYVHLLPDDLAEPPQVLAELPLQGVSGGVSKTRRDVPKPQEAVIAGTRARAARGLSGPRGVLGPGAT